MSQHKINPPSSNWADGSTQSQDKSGLVFAMIAGAVIFAVGCGSGIIVGWITGSLSGISSFLEDMDFDASITVQSSSPQFVTIGESFELVITIKDVSGNARSIEDIDFMGSLIDNASFASITPQPQSSSQSPGYIEHVFSRALPANGTTEIVFEIQPTQLGVYTGDFNVYMENYNSESGSLTIEVLPE